MYTPSLVVQVVDQTDAAIAGAEVTVTPSGSKHPVKKERAGTDGYARFWVRPDKDNST